MEGYFGPDDGVIHLYVSDFDGGVLLNAGTAEVSVTRARCRGDGDPDGIELRVEGSTHDPNTGEVTILDGPGIVEFGVEDVEAEAGNPAFGAFSFRLRNDGAFTVCPAEVTVEFEGASTTAGVD